MPAREKLPFGILTLDGDTIVAFAPFSANPQDAAAQFLAASETTSARARCHFRACGRRLFHSDRDVNRFLSAFAGSLARRKLGARSGRDKFIIFAASAAEDLEKTSNALMDRVHEWFTLHYPEHGLSKKELPGAIATYGMRERFPNFEESIGIPLNEQDAAAIRSYAAAAQQLEATKRSLELYVAAAMKEIAPNVSSVVDPLLGAKLLALAGSLEKLARLPASAIQLLGAEKALFRHLRKQGKSPKYGILFLDQRIQRSTQRGKAARLIAAKVMLAARVDHYSGRYEARFKDELAAELQAVA